MNLEKYLDENSIKIGLEASDKISALKEIAKLAVKHPLLKDYNSDKIFKKLLEREELGSTGIERNLAIPHCTLDDLKDFIIGFLIAPNGVDFDAIDGEKTKLFVFIIAPKSKRNEHIRILSKITSVLRSPARVQEIMQAKTPSVIRTSFLRHTVIEDISKQKREYNLFTVIIQREELFEDILNIFTEINDCYVSVIEANNASKYLYSLPLFSNFWSSEQKGYNRIIIAVLRKGRTNETIRKINTTFEEKEEDTGVMLIVQDIAYINGTLDL